MTDNAQDMVGDYVFGLLEGGELAAFEQALAADPDLQQQVATFRERMLSLDRTAAAAVVPASLWGRVEAAIAPTPVQAPRPAMVPRRWAGLALAASVVVAAGLGFLAGRVTDPGEQPIMIAVLLTDGSQPGAIVEAFANNRVHVRPLENFSVPEGKVLEVWTKPSEEIGPVSLGRFGRAEDIDLPGASLPTPQAGQLYEITLEDAPGSATGKPTGPILVKGFAKAPMI